MHNMRTLNFLIIKCISALYPLSLYYSSYHLTIATNVWEANTSVGYRNVLLYTIWPSVLHRKPADTILRRIIVSTT